MGIFSSIKDAIFGKKAVTPAAPAAHPSAPAPRAAPATPRAATASAPAAVPAAAPPAMREIDVIAHLEDMSAAGDRSLNWRTSIVDLMKLVGMDASLAQRKELAQELGYSGALDGSAEMNLWLHKKVMSELAAHGGKVPAELTD